TQGLQVADGGRLRELLAQVLQGGVDLLDREVRGTEARLEERDLRVEVRVPAHVERQGLVGGGAWVLADGALVLALADVHRAVVVDATPAGGLRGLRLG